MRTQLLIGTTDCDYAGHLSNIMVENHMDAIDVSVVSTAVSLREHLCARKYDIALLEASMIEDTDLQSIQLPLLLWSEEESIPGITDSLKKIRKYQRISAMVSSLLELYAKSHTNERGPDSKRARITAVWSPAGGVGKTTTALAYCAGRALAGRHALYLDLETFSSVRAYFPDTGRSISAVFEMLENREGNIEMLIRSILRQDGESDIAYFCRPENFDDMNILSVENTVELVNACCVAADELVIDLSGQCDERTRKVFELADRILLVTDSSSIAKTKYSQFASQHNIFRHIMEKSALVANKGAAVQESLVDEVIYLPFVQSDDPQTVYKALSTIRFDD